MSDFKWTPKKEKAAVILAQGYTEQETAQQVGITDRTIRRWKKELDFITEVDRLSLMIGISSRAERLRIAMRVIRQKVKEDKIETKQDIIYWLKFAQSETDGAKLDLAAIFEAMEKSAAGSDKT